MLHYHYVLMDVAFFFCFLTTGDFFKSLFFRSTCSLTRRRRLVAHTCTVPSTHSTEKQYYLAGLKMSMCER